MTEKTNISKLRLGYVYMHIDYVENETTLEDLMIYNSVVLFLQKLLLLQLKITYKW